MQHTVFLCLANGCGYHAGWQLPQLRTFARSWYCLCLVSAARTPPLYTVRPTSLRWQALLRAWGCSFRSSPSPRTFRRRPVTCSSVCISRTASRQSLELCTTAATMTSYMPKVAVCIPCSPDVHDCAWEYLPQNPSLLCHSSFMRLGFCSLITTILQ